MRSDGYVGARDPEWIIDLREIHEINMAGGAKEETMEGGRCGKKVGMQYSTTEVITIRIHILWTGVELSSRCVLHTESMITSHTDAKLIQSVRLTCPFCRSDTAKSVQYCYDSHLSPITTRRRPWYTSTPVWRYFKPKNDYLCRRLLQLSLPPTPPAVSCWAFRASLIFMVRISWDSMDHSHLVRPRIL